jgi:acyl-CoA reductase-like NAD-dependent aldehyde dehydrogenase
MDRINIISPSDGSTVATRDVATDNEINNALEKAQLAQKNWQALEVVARIEYCQKAMDWFENNKDVLAQGISEQMGRPIQYAQGEISGLIERAQYMMSIAQDALADKPATKQQGFKRFIRPTPLGTCFIIAPWNYPYLTAINGVITALLAGNSVLLKHSAQTLLCAEAFRDAFNASGLPKGVFQILHLSHYQTAELVQEPKIKFVSFTGSVNGGKAIELAAAGLFKPVALELGGKDAAYVREDANVINAAENIADGAFFNSGQSCCGIERIYVHEQVFDEFLAAMVKTTKQLKLGPALNSDTTLGPMVNTKRATFAREQIKHALKQGAVNHIDEQEFPLSKVGSCYLAPHILSNVNHSMAIMSEESFAPVVGIMKVKDDEEALKLINDSQYGLTASIWTQNEEAMLELANEIETGTVFMNRCDYLDPALAWVGIKDSGRGCSLSYLGFGQVTRPKSFHIREA